MDLKAYYQKINEAEKQITTAFAVLISLETADGGKGGVRTEVRRQVAAKMLVDGKARIADEIEIREFEEQKAEAHRQQEQLAAANRMQVTIVPTAEFRGLRSGSKVAREG